MSHYRPRKRLMAEMNVVPYIDVMLVLLIIFMVTSPMLSLTQGVDVELPKAAAEPVAQTEAGPLIVSLKLDGEYYLTYGDQDAQPVPNDLLLPRVAALLRDHPDRAVLVSADKGVLYDNVVQLMSKLRGAGVGRVGLMTQPPETAPAGAPGTLPAAPELPAAPVTPATVKPS